jgi:hypothetical protein
MVAGDAGPRRVAELGSVVLSVHVIEQEPQHN